MELPKFLNFKENNKKVTSIDFGASFIKVAFMEARGATYRLLGYVLKEFESNQKTSEEVGATLKEILEANPLAEKEACLSISEPDWIFIKKLTLPQMPKTELLGAVKWQLKAEFPFSPDESISDLKVIREYTDSEGAKKIELFCVFAKKEIVHKYVSAAISSGLAPVRVSASAFNYCGTLSSLSSHSQVSAIFDVGLSHSHIAIYQKNALSFIRSLNFSMARLANSLVGVLVTDQGKVEINLEKAWQIIHGYGIPLDEPAKLSDGLRPNQVIPLLRPLLEIAIKEIERSFDFFKSELGLVEPEILYVTGGGANLKNFIEYLSKGLKVKVEKLPLPVSLDIRNVDAGNLARDANQLSSAIDLGVSVSGINLLPREIKSQKIELIQKASLRVTAIAIGAVFIFSWFMVNFQIRDYKKRLKIAKLHLESVEEVKGLKQIVDSRENLINVVRAGKVPLDGLLKSMSALVSSSIILNELKVDQITHTMWLSGVITSGRDSVEKVLTDFMNAMENSKFIRDANLINSNEELGINSFEIKCELAK